MLTTALFLFTFLSLSSIAGTVIAFAAIFSKNIELNEQRRRDEIYRRHIESLKKTFPAQKDLYPLSNHSELI